MHPGSLRTVLLLALALPLVSLLLTAVGMSASRSVAEDGNALVGRWQVPVFEQKKSRMSEQCQTRMNAEVATIPEGELEIFDCNDPKYAPHLTRIFEFVKSVNEVYRADQRPLYSEKISGLCAIVTANKSERKQDVCNPSKKLRDRPIEHLPIMWNIRKSKNPEWPYVGDSYSPTAGFGAISCLRAPVGNRVTTKGCRRWSVEVPFVGAEPCDCGCSVVCEQFTWVRK